MNKSKKITEVKITDIDKVLNGILGSCQAGIKPDEVYCRVHDDCDGDLTQHVSVSCDSMGDMWLIAGRRSYRFRNYMGGGSSPRVHNAMYVLARAIMLDNQDKPQ